MTGSQTDASAPDLAFDDPVLIVCGTFHPNPEVHRRCMILAGVPAEFAESFDDTGCGHPMIWTIAYRCVDCGRWFHEACIRNHFRATIQAPY